MRYFSTTPLRSFVPSGDPLAFRPTSGCGYDIALTAMERMD